MGQREHRYIGPFDRYGYFARRNARNDFWVDPDGEKLDKSTHPYSYSEFYLWGGPDGRKAAKDAVYSDRLAQWDLDKYSRCCKAIAPGKRWDQMSAADVSAWMTAYLGRPITATALAEGCNVGNGYPYWIIWFKEAETPSPASSTSRVGEG